MSDKRIKEIEHIVERLNQIFLNLEGERKENVKKDEFSNIQETLSQELIELRAMISRKRRLEKEPGKVIEAAKLKQKISSSFLDLESKINRLRKIALKRENEPEGVQRVLLCEKFESVLNQVKLKYNNKQNTAEGPDNGRIGLRMSELHREVESRKLAEKAGEQSEDSYNEDDDRVINEWGQKDQKLDDKLDDINLLLDEIQAMNKELGKNIEHRNQLIGEANKQVIVVRKDIDLENNRVADVLKKMRAPSKLCRDVCLVLLLLGLIGVIVMLVKNGI